MKDHPRGALATQAGGLDIIHHRDIDGHRSAEAEHAGGIQQPHHHNQRENRNINRRQHHQRQDQRGDRHHQIDKARQRQIDPAACGGGQKPQHRPGDKGQDRGTGCDKDRHLRAIDHPRQQIAANRIRAQQMLGRHRIPDPAHQLVHLIGRNPLRKNRHQKEASGQYQPQQGRNGNTAHFGCLNLGFARIETTSAKIFSPM